MRWFLLLSALLLGACEGSFVRPENLGQRVALEKQYAARDACLVRNADADAGSTADPQSLAQAVAMACASETDKLVAATDRGDADPKVAQQIRKDTEFRALKFVMRARGQTLL